MNTYSDYSDTSMLSHISSPTVEAYEVKHHCTEITFIGKEDQPDYARALLTIHPDKMTIELKSLKLYLQQFRNRIISYERLVNVIFDDLMKVFKFRRLRLTMWFNVRGGIESKITVDSDWQERGGEDKFKDWKHDEF